MSALPWVRFFPSDWLAGTRGLSAVESGVYISLVAMMYERGEPIVRDDARLARLCGASNSTFKRALEALIDGGKIILNDGRLWNARVEKEQFYRTEKSEVGKQAAKARWGKDKRNQGKADAGAMPTQSDSNANQKPEPEEYLGLTPEMRAREDEFEAFWTEFPNKAGKDDARKAFDKARDGVTIKGKPPREPTEAAEIMAGLRRYISGKPADRQWLNPATFLNGRRWADEPAIVRQSTGPPRNGDYAAVIEAAETYIREHEESDEPPPGQDLDLAASWH